MKRSVMSQIDRFVSCFCVTDGRPWYKQIVSGLYIFVVGAIITPFVILAAAIFWGIFTSYPLALIATKIAIGIGVFIAGLMALALLVLGWVWATEDFGN